MNKQLKTAYENLIKEHGKSAGVLAPLRGALDSCLIYLPNRISEYDLDKLAIGVYYSRNKTSFLISAAITSARYTAYELAKTSRLKKIDYFGIYESIEEAIRKICPNQEYTENLDEVIIKLNKELNNLRLNISELKDLVKSDSKS